MQDLHSTIYLPRAEPSTRPGGVSRSQAEPLAPRAVRPGGAINPRPRKTTVGRLKGRPFYGQAKGQLRPTCTSYAGCAHQPSGIPVSAVSSTKAHNLKCRTQQKSTSHQTSASFLISSFLSSRAASSQVLSAFVSLTTVFGMGTGVSSQLSPLNL